MTSEHKTPWLAGPNNMKRLLLSTVSLLYSIKKKATRWFYTQITKRKVAQYTDPLIVTTKSKFTKTTYLGKNCSFNGIKITGMGKVMIGDNFHSGEDCLLISTTHNYDTGKAIPYDNTCISKDIIIEDNVWLGGRVIILGGVRIGEGAIIQAGSCVVTNIPKYAVAGGHPAKVFKQRDIEHYNKLKVQQKFL